MPVSARTSCVGMHTSAYCLPRPPSAYIWMDHLARLLSIAPPPLPAQMRRPARLGLIQAIRPMG